MPSREKLIGGLSILEEADIKIIKLIILGHITFFHFPELFTLKYSSLESFTSILTDELAVTRPSLVFSSIPLLVQVVLGTFFRFENETKIGKQNNA